MRLPQLHCKTPYPLVNQHPPGRIDVGWMACGQKTLSHCNHIPNSDHGLDWNIEKIDFWFLF